MSRKGIANLFSRACEERTAGFSSGNFRCIGIPEVESIGPGVAIRGCGDPIASGAEDRVYLIVSGEKPLCLSGRFEPAHHFLAPSGRPVRALIPVVQTLVRAMIRVRCKLADRLAIAVQPVRHDDQGLAEPGDQSL